MNRLFFVSFIFLSCFSLISYVPFACVSGGGIVYLVLVFLGSVMLSSVMGFMFVDIFFRLMC